MIVNLTCSLAHSLTHLLTHLFARSPTPTFNGKKHSYQVHTMTMTWWCFWKAPSFWTALIAIVAYWDARALNGDFVYDDAGSVVKNVVVNGHVHWREAWKRDFWGVEMTTAQSHKSFRPVTTLTLRANYLLAQWYHQLQSSTEKLKDNNHQKTEHPPTLSFHLVNLLLHGMVTGMITRATSYVLPTNIVSQLIVGLLFGLHPVHAEVVSNITSRGELLMSIFFLMAFLSFASTRQQTERSLQLHPLSSRKRQNWWHRMWGIYMLPWLCMTLSLFSKEQGATTLISLVLWDFLTYHGNALILFKKLRGKHTPKDTSPQKQDETLAWQFLIRTTILAIQTLIVVSWRYVLNGETSPDFIEAQNPAGFAKDCFTRPFSVSWVYCLYIRDALWPYFLCPDWSGISIDLIRSIKDTRAMAVIALWYMAGQSFWSMLVGGNFPRESTSASVTETRYATNSDQKKNKDTRSLEKDWWWNEQSLRQVNMSIWAFTFSPFLLSSNILVVVGLMKADRVIYLPLFGFCLLEALLLEKLRGGMYTMRTSIENLPELMFWSAHFFFMLQLFIFCGQTHQRNIAWSNSLRLWESAYAINPRSHHTRYNCKCPCPRPHTIPNFARHPLSRSHFYFTRWLRTISQTTLPRG
jgi:protein O-mannosyl-transferase